MKDKWQEIAEKYYMEVSEFTFRYFEAVKHKELFEPELQKIYPSMYQKALDDFMLFGKLTRYPKEYIFKWRYIILRNTAFLEAMTDIGGHSPCFPVDEFNEVFFPDREKYIKDFSEIQKILDDEDTFPTWSNGQWLLSDYAIKPLTEIVWKMYQTEDADEILVELNKALDIYHQRSDLSELFVHGGQEALTKVSN